MCEYHFYNQGHIGDCIMPLRFFYSIRNLLVEKQIRIKFYYNNGYINNTVKELLCYSIHNVIEIFPISMRPADSFNTWIGNDIGNVKHTDWSNYYELLQTKMVSYMNLQDCSINCNFLLDESYLLNKYDSLDEKYKNIDILIINSLAYSGQYNKDPKEMDDLCRYLNKSYNIVTSRKVDDIKCTVDVDYRIQDIGAIATHAKYIISIMTGPINGIINIQSYTFVKKWFIIVTNMHHYAFKYINCDFIVNGNLQPIYTYFTRSPERPPPQGIEEAHPL